MESSGELAREASPSVENLDPACVMGRRFQTQVSSFRYPEGKEAQSYPSHLFFNTNCRI